MSQAWHTAAFPLMKKFPKLKDVIAMSPRRPRVSTLEAKIAAALAWDRRINAGKS